MIRRLIDGPWSRRWPSLAYWVRPFDMLLDARRWRWAPDGHVVQAPAVRAIRAALADGTLTFPDRPGGASDA